MQNKSDAELVREYAVNRSEAAFGEIVHRYTDMVHSAAMRQTCSPELARDVVQAVFTDLARKAGSLPAGTLLIGWLCRGARLAALRQVRGDRRRLHRESQAMEWHEAAPEMAKDWEAIRPVLDEAMASLPEADQNALLLRFFKDASLTSVGATLGVSADAAQKRVARALAKLREFLAGRGIHTSQEALAIALAGNAVQAAPLGLAASMVSGALAAVGSASATTFVSKLFTVTTMKTTLLILGLAGIIAALAYQQRNTQGQLRAAVASAEQQAEELQRLREVNALFEDQANELKRLRDEAQDAPRLRAELARLRRERAEPSSLAAKGAAPEAKDATPEPSILVTAKFISINTAKLREAGWTKPPKGGVELMDDSQVRAMCQALGDGEGMEVFSQPAVQTANGREAVLSVTQQHPVGGTNANVGTILRLSPYYATNSSNITLDLAAEVSRLVDTAGKQDESQWDLQAITFTNSVVAADGQSILWREDFVDKGRIIGSTNVSVEPKSLLVLVKPQLVDAYGSAYRRQRVVKRIRAEN